MPGSPVAAPSAHEIAPIIVKTTMDSPSTIDPSTTAGVSGRPDGVITPIWSFEVIRDEKIAPNAPAFDANGGISDRRAGTAVGPASRACGRPPERMASVG